MNSQVGFEYRNNKKWETAFETFLRYSDEKEKSAAVLGKVLSRLFVRHGMTLLDVGSGNGGYLHLALCGMRGIKKTIFTLLEPSDDLVKQLRRTATRFPPNAVVKIIRSTFEEFTADNRFDVVLASHVPLAKDNVEKLPEVYARMLELLKPGGCLIVVLRGRDDIHEFRTVFKSWLIGREYRSLTIDDTARILKRVAKTASLWISKFSVNAKLRLPYPDNMRHVISIVEFLLNKNWEEIPDDIREAILAYIQRKRGILRQIDGFLVVKRR